MLFERYWASYWDVKVVCQFLNLLFLVTQTQYDGDDFQRGRLNSINLLQNKTAVEVKQ